MAAGICCCCAAAPRIAYSFSPLEELRYRLFAEWLPGGQAIHCVSLGAFWAPEGMMLRALAVIAVSTGVGICLFRRKDLK